MSNICELCGDRCCLCSACRAMRKAVEDSEKVTLKEAKDIFHEMEKMLNEYHGDESSN